MKFKDAVEETPATVNRYCQGLRALRPIDRKKIRPDNPRRLTGSVDVDTAMIKVDPTGNRWDYGVGYQPANLPEGDEVVYWIETHIASDAQVETVLRKYDWLKRWLRDQAPKFKPMKRLYVWLSSRSTQFTTHSAAKRKKMAEQGLLHKGHLRIPDIWAD